MTDRYRHAPELPLVVFVCPSEEDALSLISAADREVTGRLARLSTHPETWPAPGRRRMLFVAERDVHAGSDRALMLPRQAPSERESPRLSALGARLPLRSRAPH